MLEPVDIGHRRDGLQADAMRLSLVIRYRIIGWHMDFQPLGSGQCAQCIDHAGAVMQLKGGRSDLGRVDGNGSGRIHREGSCKKKMVV